MELNEIENGIVTERSETVVHGDEHDVVVQQVVRPEEVAATRHGVEATRVHKKDYRELPRTENARKNYDKRTKLNKKLSYLH